MNRMLSFVNKQYIRYLFRNWNNGTTEYINGLNSSPLSVVIYLVVPSHYDSGLNYVTLTNVILANVMQTEASKG